MSADEVISDFELVLKRSPRSPARPESELPHARAVIIDAILSRAGTRTRRWERDEYGEREVSPVPNDDLKLLFSELATFVPAREAALVASYRDSQESGRPSTLSATDKDRAEVVLQVIETAQSHATNTYLLPTFAHRILEAMPNTAGVTRQTLDEEELKAHPQVAAWMLFLAFAGFLFFKLITVGHAIVGLWGFWVLEAIGLSLMTVLLSVSKRLYRRIIVSTRTRHARYWGHLLSPLFPSAVLLAALALTFESLIAPDIQTGRVASVKADIFASAAIAFFSPAVVGVLLAIVFVIVRAIGRKVLS
jgi:hypothetical protein